ncbi:hypothetical protein COB72_06865 [bacterium]|nr:MAG: hypothetical protein COB72_06865 [bacterium]
MSKQQQTPTCPTCNYDLTGLIKQGSSATCPECGHAVHFESTLPRPWFIESTKKPILIATIPPAAMFTVIITLGEWAINSNRSLLLNQLPSFIFCIGLTLFWFFAVALTTAIIIKRWKGPPGQNSPTKAFAKVMAVSTICFAPVFILYLAFRMIEFILPHLGLSGH